MKKVTLKFSNAQELWAFAKTLKVQNLKMDTKALRLVCLCDENVLAEAVAVYKATVVPEKENQSL